MKISAWASLALGSSLEALAWASLLLAEGPLALVGFGLAHLLGSALLTLSLRRVWVDLTGPEEDRAAPPRRLILFAALLALPGVGALLVGAALAARRDHRPPTAEPFRAVSLPSLPEKARSGAWSSDEGGGPERLGEARACLRGSADVNRRLTTLLSTKRLDDQAAVPLLTQALRDSVDEVRLLAHALRDARERRLYARVAREERRLEEEPNRPAVRVSLAQLYWELVFVGIAEGDAARKALMRARQHAQAALAREPENGAVALLLTRILLQEDAALDVTEPSSPGGPSEARALSEPSEAGDAHAPALNEAVDA